MKKSMVLGNQGCTRDHSKRHRRESVIQPYSSRKISLLSVFAMNFARYSTIAAVSSPTGLMKWGGNANPY